MKRFTGAIWLIAAMGFAEPAGFSGNSTDANIITGLDISNSISPDEIQLELAGLAHAIRDPRVMEAIEAGKLGRIGFAVFAWHHGQFPRVVDWMVIDTPRDAEDAAHAIQARQVVNLDLEGRAQTEWYIGRLTDLSQAIDYANDALAMAPFRSDRAIVNIVGNGEDNVGEGPRQSRNRFVAAGGTINGLVLGQDPEMIAYYRDSVIGGRAAFVTWVSSGASFANAFVRKLIGDIIADGADHRPLLFAAQNFGCVQALNSSALRAPLVPIKPAHAAGP